MVIPIFFPVAIRYDAVQRKALEASLLKEGFNESESQEIIRFLLEAESVSSRRQRKVQYFMAGLTLFIAVLMIASIIYR
jgi:hypothetical protein